MLENNLIKCPYCGTVVLKEITENDLQSHKKPPPRLMQNRLVGYGILLIAVIYRPNFLSTYVETIGNIDEAVVKRYIQKQTEESKKKKTIKSCSF